MTINIAAEIEAAELTGNSALLAAIARQLLASSAPTKKPATRARKGSSELAYLTLTERRALNLPPIKRGKIGGGVYRWVLVEFANGVRMVTGQYPDAKNPDDLSQAVISARARYLGILSGRYLSARYSADVPTVTNMREIGAEDAQQMRTSCQNMRMALEAFTREIRERRVLAYLTARHERKIARQWAAEKAASPPARRLQFDQSFQVAAE